MELFISYFKEYFLWNCWKYCLNFFKGFYMLKFTILYLFSWGQNEVLLSDLKIRVPFYTCNRRGWFIQGHRIGSYFKTRRNTIPNITHLETLNFWMICHQTAKPVHKRIESRGSRFIPPRPPRSSYRPDTHRSEFPLAFSFVLGRCFRFIIGIGRENHQRRSFPCPLWMEWRGTACEPELSKRFHPWEHRNSLAKADLMTVN